MRCCRKNGTYILSVDQLLVGIINVVVCLEQTFLLTSVVGLQSSGLFGDESRTKKSSEQQQQQQHT